MLRSGSRRMLAVHRSPVALASPTDEESMSNNMTLRATSRRSDAFGILDAFDLAKLEFMVTRNRRRRPAFRQTGLAAVDST